MRERASKRVVGRPPKRDGDDSRSRILEAAISVFAEKGIAASAIKDIGQRAGVTAAMVYYHFEDKERLTEAALERYLVPLVDHYWAAVDLGLGPRETLLEVVDRIRRATTDSPWFLPLWSRELASEGGYLRVFLGRRIERRLLETFRQAVLQGQAEGLLNPDLMPEMLFISLISALCLPSLARPDWQRLWGRSFSDAEFFGHCLAMISGGLFTCGGGPMAGGPPEGFGAHGGPVHGGPAHGGPVQGDAAQGGRNGYESRERESGHGHWRDRRPHFGRRSPWAWPGPDARAGRRPGGRTPRHRRRPQGRP
jgi:AcrR family transcriptional regulator